MIAKKLNKPSNVLDEVLWNLITKMLSFDGKDRISASEALNHEFFTGEKADEEISMNAFRLAQTAQKALQKGDKNINQYDLDASFTFPYVDAKEIVNKDPESEMKTIQNKFNLPIVSNFISPIAPKPKLKQLNFFESQQHSFIQPDKQIQTTQSHPIEQPQQYSQSLIQQPIIKQPSPQIQLQPCQGTYNHKISHVVDTLIEHVDESGNLDTSYFASVLTIPNIEFFTSLNIASIFPDVRFYVVIAHLDETSNIILEQTTSQHNLDNFALIISHHPQNINIMRSYFEEELKSYQDLEIQSAHDLIYIGFSPLQDGCCVVFLTSSTLTLETGIQQGLLLNNLIKLQITKSLIDSIQYAHQNNIIGFDIRTNTILITQDINKLSIALIGYVGQKDQLVKHPDNENIQWDSKQTAPELLVKKRKGSKISYPTTASDIYSLGLLIQNIFGQSQIITDLIEPTLEKIPQNRCDIQSFRKEFIEFYNKLKKEEEKKRLQEKLKLKERVEKIKSQQLKRKIQQQRQEKQISKLQEQQQMRKIDQQEQRIRQYQESEQMRNIDQQQQRIRQYQESEQMRNIEKKDRNSQQFKEQQQMRNIDQQEQRIRQYQESEQMRNIDQQQQRIRQYQQTEQMRNIDQQEQRIRQYQESEQMRNVDQQQQRI